VTLPNGLKLTSTAIKVLKALLENAREGAVDLGKKLNLAHTTVLYVINEKLSKLGGRYVYFLNPERLGMRVAVARVKPEPAKIEDVAASLTLSPLVRQLFIEPTSDEIYAVVVAPEWKLREFRHRLRTTPFVREYQLLPMYTRKFEQPIPPEMLDELVRVAGGGE